MGQSDGPIRGNSGHPLELLVMRALSSDRPVEPLPNLFHVKHCWRLSQPAPPRQYPSRPHHRINLHKVDGGFPRRVQTADVMQQPYRQCFQVGKPERIPTFQQRTSKHRGTPRHISMVSAGLSSAKRSPRAGNEVTIRMTPAKHLSAAEVRTSVHQRHR